MKKKMLLSAIAIALFLSVMTLTVYAQVGYVQIGTPNSSNSYGVQTSSGYWIGQFPITLNPGTSSAHTGEVYCMTPDGTVYEGSNYPATQVQVTDVTDSGIPLQTWQEISYIMTWDAPTTANGGAIDQVAIWMLLGQNPTSGTSTDPQYAHFTLDSSIISQAKTLVNNVQADGGMNVALQGATMRWVTPSIGTAGNPGAPVSTTARPGDAVNFQVQLFDASGNAECNVQIQFSGTVTPPSSTPTTLPSTYISPVSAITNDDGIASVTVTVPPSTAVGSTITLTASTHTLWPVEYLDLIDGTPGTQNLIGICPALTLTTTYHVYIQGSILVLPESAYGALSAIVACAAGFMIYYKVKPASKQPKA